MRKLLLFLCVLALVPAAVSAEQLPSTCGTQEVPPAFASFYASTTAAAAQALPHAKSTFRIPVAFHAIHDGRRGKVSPQQVAVLINNLNWAFRSTPFSFYLYRSDSTKNKAWFNNCLSNSRNQQKMKKQLARDTRLFLNIYSCNPYVAGQGVLGQATFPFLYPNGSFLHGVLIHPSALPGGSPDWPYGLVAAHEVGHYLGIFHTFQGGCADGDAVADTPAQLEPHHSCPSGVDSCPTMPGPDDVPNFMNYSTDECMQHFTPGQTDLMVFATRLYRPNLGL